MKTKYVEINIIVNCNDGITIETQEIDEIFSFENDNSRKIESIKIKASENAENSIAIKLSSKSHETSELFIISSSDEQGFLIFQEISRRIKNMHQWYDLIARTPLVFLLLVPFSVYSISNILGDFNAAANGPSDPFSFSSFITLFTLSIILLILAIYPLERLKEYLFPKAFFLLGDQIAVMTRIKFWRMTIFGSIFLSVILGVLTNWISKIMGI